MKKISREELEGILRENSAEDGRRANLIRADLSYLDLKYLKFRNADLRYADLRNSDLSYSDLRNVKFRYSDLRNTKLICSDLRDSDLRNANLINSDLSNTDLIDAGLIVLYLPYWTVYVHRETIRIGCRHHSHEEWKNFTDEEISKMDKNALVFWKQYKALIFEAVKALGVER